MSPVMNLAFLAKITLLKRNLAKSTSAVGVSTSYGQLTKLPPTTTGLAMYCRVGLLTHSDQFLISHKKNQGSFLFVRKVKK